MIDLSVKKINKMIDEFSNSGKQPEKLLVGYKTYSRLMNDEKFAEKVVPSSDDPKLRTYKNLKIQLITEKHYFEVC
ncbi:hypothetical protein [Acinetobacter stercoris]|uniref:Uncharacterized protein n=1 Tax=Acinetobacter stercoris TaxID=2126983 RepID=A0A2U3N1C2_9GAMM|nr:MULTISPECIES: hypothetical protein [Acinetobacter]SPL71458.1 hypothetical protein KPC_2636 [Acinetobacter stercoris]